MTVLDHRRSELTEDCARLRVAMEGPRSASTLCPQERVVLRMVGLGMTDKAIGEALGIRKWTVRCYLKRIHDKTAVPYRPRLALAAYRVIEAGN